MNHKSELPVIDDQDFARLSALLDDELDSADKALMIKRLAHEPALQQQYLALQKLQRSMQARRGTSTKPSRKLTFKPLAIAAGIVAIVVSLNLLQQPSETQAQAALPSIAALHQALSQQPLQFARNQQHQLIAANHQGAFIQPDLTLSKLYLMARNDSDTDRVLHYRGVNGCKLTLQISPAAPLANALGEQWQHRHWQAGRFSYQLIASGMDQGRFQSVADYIEQMSIKASHLDKLQMAMLSHYRAAQPCS